MERKSETQSITICYVQSSGALTKVFCEGGYQNSRNVNRRRLELRADNSVITDTITIVEQGKYEISSRRS